MPDFVLLAALHDVDLALFGALNGLVGRSWTLDSLIALATDNPLVKAGPIGACFFYAWYRADADDARDRRRRVLLVTLLSLLIVAPATKAMSDAALAPRPFVYSETSYSLQEGALVERRAAEFRTLQTGDLKRRVEAMREGKIGSNDFGSFPSDHAAFFTALSLGIFLASRKAGAIALAWTVAVVLGSRVAVGLHWPIDVAAGAAFGAAVLLLVQWVAARHARRPVAVALHWSDRHPGIAAGLLFLVLLESANVLLTLRTLLDVGSATAERLL